MSESIYACELCDSINVSVSEEQSFVQVPLTEPIQQILKVCKCHDCGAETVLESEPSKSIRVKAFEQGKKSIAHLFQHVNECGFTDARIERVLGLSPHTLNRWKEGKKVSASALALSRFIALFPELVFVAETGFEPNRSRHIVFNETRNWLCKNYVNGGAFNISLNHSGNSFQMCGVLLAENDQMSNDYNLALRMGRQQNTEQLVKV